jgi:glycosyltransferase involved in cell wall biosynthesis
MPKVGQVSIELVFEQVRARLSRVEVEVFTSTHPNLGVLPRLRAIIEASRHQGDVTHMLGDSHYLDLLLRRSRTVLTVHDLEFLHRAGNSAVKKFVYRWLWLRLPVWRASMITAVSTATRDDLIAVTGVKPERVRVIPNPVRDPFVPAPVALPANPRPVVLLVGTWPSKNLDNTAAALRGLDVKVVLVGPMSDEHRRLFEGLEVENRVDLSDAQMVATVQGCDLLLFASLNEGFGLPIVEAQACGRPVVTSDREPMREVSGGAACLVDPTDVTSIRDGVRRVLDDGSYRRALISAGLVNAQRFRPEPIARAYEEVYLQVASRR